MDSDGLLGLQPLLQSMVMALPNLVKILDGLDGGTNNYTPHPSEPSSRSGGPPLSGSSLSTDPFVLLMNQLQSSFEEIMKTNCENIPVGKTEESSSVPQSNRQNQSTASKKSQNSSTEETGNGGKKCGNVFKGHGEHNVPSDINKNDTSSRCRNTNNNNNCRNISNCRNNNNCRNNINNCRDTNDNNCRNISSNSRSNNNNNCIDNISINNRALSLWQVRVRVAGGDNVEVFIESDVLKIELRRQSEGSLMEVRHCITVPSDVNPETLGAVITKCGELIVCQFETVPDDGFTGLSKVKKGEEAKGSKQREGEEEKRNKQKEGEVEKGSIPSEGEEEKGSKGNKVPEGNTQEKEQKTHEKGQ